MDSVVDGSDPALSSRILMMPLRSTRGAALSLARLGKTFTTVAKAKTTAAHYLRVRPGSPGSIP